MPEEPQKTGFERWETPFERSPIIILSIAAQPTFYFTKHDRVGFEDPAPVSRRDNLIVRVCDLSDYAIYEVYFEEPFAFSLRQDGADQEFWDIPRDKVSSKSFIATNTPMLRAHPAIDDAVSFVLGPEKDVLEVATYSLNWSPTIRQTGTAKLSALTYQRDQDDSAPDGNLVEQMVTRGAVLQQISAGPARVHDDGTVHNGTEIWQQRDHRVILR